MKVAIRRTELLVFHAIEFYSFASRLFLERRFIVPLVMLFLLFYPSMFQEHEIPTYRVILDPGHGGIAKHPMSVHGDRYDTIQGRYLETFKEGASRRALHEHIIVYDIARRAERLLRHLAPGGDAERFYRVLKKYTVRTPRAIYIETGMSRGKSITEEESDLVEDPNAPFRLFDYPDARGAMQKGRISRINQGRPHLVVSLHMAAAGPRDYEGMNPVIIPPHSLLRKGFEYLRGQREGSAFFRRSPYRDWFIENTSRSDFSWFLNDTSIYFTGYPLRRDRETDMTRFRGYRYNMVNWSYADDPGWERAARHRIRSSRYAPRVDDFVAEGRFWARERSTCENFRRGGGEEGFGGDNAYASYEIIRYICYSLRMNGDDHPSQKPGKSYVSVWIMPLHVNAVNAFIELGYLNRKRDRHLFTKRKNELAEGIAVGIYSLCAGLEVKEREYKYAPRGKRIDFGRYRLPDGSSYFDAVVAD